MSKFLRNLLSGTGVVCLGLVSYLIGWGFFKGIAVGILAILLDRVIHACTKHQ